MNKFKTAISLCLATLMILSTVGCVSTPPENTSDSGNTSNSENNGQADNNSENTSLEIWSFYSPGTVQSDVYESIVDKYMDENPGVEVTIEFVGQDIMSKLRPRLIQKDVPDIVMLNPGYADVLASEKMLLPLDSYFDGKNYEESGTWRDDFIANTIETGAFRGNAYMVPEQLAVTAWFYNKAIFREYGLEVPETFEEFLAVCETLKENGIDPIASDGNIDYYLAWFFSSFAIREAGVEKYIAALNGEMEWTEPEFIEAARKEQQILPYFQKGFRGTQYPAANAIFVQGSAAMMYIGSWLPQEVATLTPEGFEMGMFAFPAVGAAGEERMLETKINGYSIPADAKNVDGAIHFLKFLTTKECSEQIASLDQHSAVKDVTVPESLTDVLALIEAADIVVPQYSYLQASEYVDWSTMVLYPLNASFMYGDIATPEEFMESVQTKTEEYFANQT